MKDGFLFPFRGSGLQTIGALTVFLYVVGLVTPFDLEFFIFYAFLLSVVRCGAQGDRELPDTVDYLDLWDNLILPGLRGIAASLIVLVPAGIYLYYRKDPILILQGDPAAIGLFFLGICYGPIAFAVAAINQNLFDVINPFVGIRLIHRAFASYAKLVAGLFAIVLFAIGVKWLRLLWPDGATIPVLSPCIGIFISLLPPIWGAYAIGRWVFRNGEVLDYEMLSSTGRALAYIPGARDYHQVRRELAPIDRDLDLAAQNVQQGEIPAARAILEDLCARFPEDPRPQEAQLQIGLDTKNCDLAGQGAGALISDALLRRDLPFAISTYRRLVEGLQGEARMPAITLYKLGQECSRVGEFDLAIKAFCHIGIQFPGDLHAGRALVMAADLLVDKCGDPIKGGNLFRLLQPIYQDATLADRIRASLRRADRLAMQQR